ncbi:hypothetical protein HDU81_008649 [Chytriomyces hyalinus]|nr:hypothetical protein HDU81_008649 [Chytriomyces hyalinus]
MDSWDAISQAINADPPAYAGPDIDITAIRRLAEEAESPREVLLFATQMLSSLAQPIDTTEDESVSEEETGLESDVEEMHETQLDRPLKASSDVLAIAAKAAALVHVVTTVLNRITSKKYAALIEPVHGALTPVYPLLSRIASLKLSIDTRARAIAELVTAFAEIVSSISAQKRANLATEELKKLDLLILDMSDCICASIMIFSATASDLESTIQIILHNFNETLAKQFDFLKLAHDANQRSTPSSTVAFPFVAQKRLHHQNAPEPVTEWIPRVITASALFHDILPTLVALLQSAPSNSLHMTCSLSILEHFSKVKKSIHLRSLDSGPNSSPTEDFFTALLGTISQTPNPAQRTPLVESFTLLFNQLLDRQSKLEVIENKMLTSKHENMRAFGVYTYKNWVMEVHKLGASGSMDQAPRVAKLCFSLDSAVYSVSTRALPFMHDDDAFFQVLPVIAQAVNFLSYLKRYALYNKLDHDAYMKRIQVDFVDPLCHRVDVMLQARKRAMERLKAGQSHQCEEELSSLSLLFFQLQSL